MEREDLQWSLHLHGGVATLTLRGEWDERSEHVIAGVIERLIRSGHLEILVDVTRVEGLSPAQPVWLDSLERIAGQVRAHRGYLDVISALPAVQQMIRARAGSALGWASSEEEALCHRLHLPVVTPGPRVATRLVGSDGAAH
ncbi:MAG: hypothetical protein RMJ43_16060 [Chloroherpetonaceae bacterium]|nr:hypothetical protein [Chthonomonadaceae bacterium]MDW8209349.1 hypothetical protein [Chloroherpetonaceae bacterium]